MIKPEFTIAAFVGVCTWWPRTGRRQPRAPVTRGRVGRSGPALWRHCCWPWRRTCRGSCRRAGRTLRRRLVPAGCCSIWWGRPCRSCFWRHSRGWVQSRRRRGGGLHERQALFRARLSRHIWSWWAASLHWSWRRSRPVSGCWRCLLDLWRGSCSGDRMRWTARRCAWSRRWIRLDSRRIRIGTWDAQSH